MTLNRRLLAAVLCILAPATSCAESLYSVGNSLTLDCCGNGAISAFDASLGNSLIQDSHIRLGAALDYMVAHPEDNGGAILGWNQALSTQHWDFLAVEPYPSATSTLATDIDAISQLITAARSNSAGGPAQVLLFAAWPSTDSLRTSGGFTEYWYQSLPGKIDQKTILARQYHEVLLARLTAKYGNAPTFRIVPAGDLMAAVDAAIRGGRLGTLSSVEDLYRDSNHLSDAGRYLAGLATILTLRSNRVSGLPIPATYMQNFNGARITGPLVADLERIAQQQIPALPAMAPQAISVTPIQGGVRLSWPRQQNDSAYALYRSAPDAADIDAEPAAFSFDQTAFDVLLMPGKTYRFGIRAISRTDISALSAPITVTQPPATPQDLLALPAIGRVTLTWRAAAGAESYDIHAGTSADAASASLIASGLSATSFVVQDAGVTAQRHYFVVARVGSVRSVASLPVVATALEPAPVGDASNGGGGSFTLWELVALLLVSCARSLRHGQTMRLAGRWATSGVGNS